MKNLTGNKIRVFLLNRLFTGVCGMTADAWLRLLREHRFAIDRAYWPRAAFITGASLITSVLSWYEGKVYGPKVKDVNVKPPLFVLGHWRSGTTLLHNLLAVDPQFAYPNTYQGLNPHTFLTTERYLKPLGFLSPRTRIVDNMRLGFDMPYEDEFAICNTTFLSPYMSWAFPRSQDYYERYLTFRDVSEAEIAEWQAALVLFFKKLTWKYDRPLLLKSPPHTCRIRLLLDTFPNARFVHIHRNPYVVFQSTKRLVEFMFGATCLQHPDLRDIDMHIIQRYQNMHNVFFEERKLIPEGRFHEVRFEDLENDPLGQVEAIYEKLGLPGFEAVKPALERYIDSIAGYRKHEYPALPASLRREIAHAWRQSFDVWGYPLGL